MGWVFLIGAILAEIEQDVDLVRDAIVRDPVTAEALKPYYKQLCKRPCFHDEYLRAARGAPPLAR